MRYLADEGGTPPPTPLRGKIRQTGFNRLPKKGIHKFSKNHGKKGVDLGTTPLLKEVLFSFLK